MSTARYTADNPKQEGAAIPAMADAPRAPTDHGANEHPVFQIPFSVVIDGRSFEGAGISVIGCDAKGLVSPNLAGSRRVVSLQFAFPGFNVTMPVDARIEDSSPDRGTVHLRFLDPIGPHLPQLRYILNAYVAGDLVGLDKVLVAGEAPAEEKAAARAPRRSSSLLGGIGRGVRVLLLAAATIALVGFVGEQLYKRFFVTPVAGLPVVTMQGTTLRAISAGQLEFVNDKATKGQPAFAIRTLSGEVVTIQMPCDCTVVPGGAAVGATLVAGDPVMQVAPPNSPIVVKATVTPDTLRALVGGATAEVSFPDGTTTAATISPDSARSAAFTAGNADGIDISLIPTTTIGADRLGTPVSVAVLSHPLAGLGDLFGTKELVK